MPLTCSQPCQYFIGHTSRAIGHTSRAISHYPLVTLPVSKWAQSCQFLLQPPHHRARPPLDTVHLHVEAVLVAHEVLLHITLELLGIQLELVVRAILYDVGVVPKAREGRGEGVRLQVRPGEAVGVARLQAVKMLPLMMITTPTYSIWPQRSPPVMHACMTHLYRGQ